MKQVEKIWRHQTYDYKYMYSCTMERGNTEITSSESGVLPIFHKTISIWIHISGLVQQTEFPVKSSWSIFDALMLYWFSSSNGKSGFPPAMGSLGLSRNLCSSGKPMDSLQISIFYLHSQFTFSLFPLYCTKLIVRQEPPLQIPSLNT